MNQNTKWPGGSTGSLCCQGNRMKGNNLLILKNRSDSLDRFPHWIHERVERSVILAKARTPSMNRRPSVQGLDPSLRWDDKAAVHTNR
jgi:hypothetical protein